MRLTIGFGAIERVHQPSLSFGLLLRTGWRKQIQSKWQLV